MPAKIEQAVEAFGKTLEDMTSARTDALTEIRDLQIAQRALFEHEASRLVRKLGVDHPRTKRLEVASKAKLDLVDKLAVERDLARIKVAKTKATEGLFHGRVVDKNGVGIKGLKVFVANEGGNRLRSVKEAETDASGYYAVKAAGALLERLERSNPDGVLLIVENAKGEQVHKARDLVKLAKGEHVVREVAVARKTVITPVTATRRRRRGRPAPPRTRVKTAPKTKVRKAAAKKKAAKRKTAGKRRSRT